MAKERILVAVKTYPTLSLIHGETVCTGGVRQDGSWVRIYPVPFRRLEEEQQYRKFDWIECDLIRSRKDRRPETYHPADPKQLRRVGHVGTGHNWRERRRLLLQTAKVYTSLKLLIDGAKANTLSLAVFKPTTITRFVWEGEEREWDQTKVAKARNATRQEELFSEETWRRTFNLLPKLPYSFSYEFEDAEGRASKLQILDWEIGALFGKCLHRHGGDETTALEKVRMKYVDQFLKTDIHFFLGTTLQFHFRAPNPWVIIGVFPIPRETQPDLF